MLCKGDNPVLQIVGVEHICWNGGSFRVEPRDFSALAFRIRGSAVIGSNHRQYRVNANDILYLPQNLSYTAEYTDTEMIVLHFIAQHDDDAPEVYRLENSEQLYKMFLRAHRLWQDKEPGYPMYVLSQFYGILGMIFEKETKATLPAHFLNAISFINANYRSSNLSIGTVCSQAGIGATVFRQLFKKHYQKPPTEYITDLRLEYARNLIAGGAPIELAASESGFNDPKYFARIVKKKFGCTPRDMKNYGK